MTIKSFSNNGESLAASYNMWVHATLPSVAGPSGQPLANRGGSSSPSDKH